VAVAKNATLTNSTMSWNLHFHCHEKKHALFILSWVFVCSWWFYAMYECPCLSLKKGLGLLKKISILCCPFQNFGFPFQKFWCDHTYKFF